MTSQVDCISKKYKTIVIDFPYDIKLSGKNKLRPKKRIKLPYKTMSIEEIKHFPIEKFAEHGAHVYIWFPNRTMWYFREIFESLKLNFHIIEDWIKPNGLAPCYTYKFATEYCVLGFFGKPMIPFNRNNLGKFEARVNWIKADCGEHSTKPPEMYELIKKMSPSPRLDMFARQRHDGFDAWGDQVEPLLQTTLTNEVLTL